MTMSRCKVGDIIAAASPAETLALLAALKGLRNDGGYVWSAKNLSKAINQTSFSVGATTIKEHRNRTCACNDS